MGLSQLGANQANSLLSIGQIRADRASDVASARAAGAVGYGEAGMNAAYMTGNAQSAGAIAQGNAWNQGIGNALSAYAYGQNMDAARESAGLSPQQDFLSNWWNLQTGGGAGMAANTGPR